jgi:hypothetical protein
MAKKLDNPVIDIKTGRPLPTHAERVSEAQALYDEYHFDMSDDDLKTHPIVAKYWDHIKTVPVPNNVISMAQFKEKRGK